MISASLFPSTQSPHPRMMRALRPRRCLAVSAVRHRLSRSQHLTVVAQTEDADVVVKAQVLAGGRGLGHFDNGYQGGVQICAG